MAGLLVEFMQEYADQLAELTSPVKSKINSLTMLAAEEAIATPAAAPSIAAAIEKRIMTAPATMKLPALFLLDSITKNAKEPFIQIFSRNLPQVFCTLWEASPRERATLQRVLGTWDRIFPPPALDAIRRRTGLAPVLASAAPLAGAPVAGQPALQAAVGPAAAVLAPAMLPVPVQQPAGYSPQQLLVQQLIQQQQQQQQVQQQKQLQLQAGGGLGPDQYAQLREAAAARLASLRAPPQQGQGQGQHGSTQAGNSAGSGPYGAGQRGRGYAAAAPVGSREYEPTMPAASGAAAMQPEQLSQLEVLLRSLAQGGSTAAAMPAPTSRAPARSLDELWSPSVLRARNPTVVQTLLEAFAAMLPAQLDRVFAAKRRARARGAAKASRAWFPTPEAWLAGSAPEAVPGAAFGQQAAAEEKPAEAHSVPADDSQTQCALSGEKFETFWDDEQQQWRYKNAKRLSADEAARYGMADGAIVLVSALGTSGTAMDPAATGAAAGGALAATDGLAATPLDGSGASVEAADLAAATEDAAGEGAAGSRAPDGPVAVAGVKAEPAQQKQAGLVTAGDAAGAVHAVEDDLQNGAVKGRAAAKRPLESEAGVAEGPPAVKVKREMT